MSLRDVLPKTWSESDGRASVGGVPLSAIAEEYGTPAYVFDQAHLEHRLEEFSAAMGTTGTPVYATKAFLCTALAELLARTEWWVDVVSAGEAAIARRGGIPASRTLLHGNLKSAAEVALAVNGDVAVTVVDSLPEIEDLELATSRAGKVIDVMVRLNEHMNLATNSKVLTTGSNAKFGLTPGAAETAIDRISASAALRLRGVHLHAGSHITDPDLFGAIVHRLAELVMRKRSAFETSPILLDVGGGLASPYLRTDPAPTPVAVADAIRSALQDGPASRIGEVRVMVEPGRALVANSALLLYTVGVRKPLPVGGEMLALDGGLTDNPRPALYDSRYELLAVDRLDLAHDHPFRVFGRMCETDVLLDSVRLPESIGEGDLVAMPTAGAYTFSMSSRYNVLPRPPVLFVSDGQVKEVVRRETIEDLLSGQRTLGEAQPRSCNVPRSGL
ncbi:MAG: diaminopimelate decarboxylase [bacterium]|nr:diaminopimelate decarboxylase [bacterium]MDE0290160.1 diaminopimelate decarboxylase [bacterium]MDE0440002.1 diaminopimelate decarboxylase [bacterium]